MAAFAAPTASLLGSLFGGLFNPAAGYYKAQEGLTQQTTAENATEFQNLLALYNQLQPFYQQYMGQGSPILNQIQAGSANQTATDYANAAAQTQQQLASRGYGFGPSGATAGALGNLNAERASTLSTNYLQNLLANEQVKFQAAQGMQGLAGIMKPNQQPANNPVPFDYSNMFNGLANGIGGLVKAGTGGSGGTIPNYNPNTTYAGTSPGPWASGGVFTDAGTMPSVPFTPPSTNGFMA